MRRTLTPVAISQSTLSLANWSKKTPQYLLVDCSVGINVIHTAYAVCLGLQRRPISLAGMRQHLEPSNKMAMMVDLVHSTGTYKSVLKKKVPVKIIYPEAAQW